MNNKVCYTVVKITLNFKVFIYSLNMFILLSKLPIYSKSLEMLWKSSQFFVPPKQKCIQIYDKIKRTKISKRKKGEITDT